MTCFGRVVFIFSALIMHNRDGVTAFRLANGYATLKDALNTENERFQRLAREDYNPLHVQI